MKEKVQRILQMILGFDRYLWFFTRYKLRTLKQDQGENDFFHFLKMLPKDAVVLDIGANLGLMSYYLCKHAGEVHAFEPIPANIKVLNRLKKRFSLTNLNVYPYALGDFTGDIDLILPVVKGVKKQGLSHVKAEKMTDFNEGILHKSKIFKLDEFETLKDQRIDAIKIDVENFEYEVFLGAREIIKRDKPMIYCELWNNQNRRDCFDLMMEFGYDIKVLDKNQLVLWESYPGNTQNFFFTARES